MSAERPEPPACSHWLYDKGDWCRSDQTRRYTMGHRCERHRPGEPEAQR